MTREEIQEWLLLALDVGDIPLARQVLYILESGGAEESAEVEAVRSWISDVNRRADELPVSLSPKRLPIPDFRLKGDE